MLNATKNILRGLKEANEAAALGELDSTLSQSSLESPLYRALHITLVRLKQLHPGTTRGATNSRIFYYIIQENGTGYKPLTIWLKIAPPTATILSEVRINIKGLVALLRSVSLHRNSTIRLALRNEGQIQESVISIASLQQGIFLL
jgi:hypothetical protein